MNALSLEKFQSVDANPGATLQKFHDYTEHIKLFFQLKFRKSDGTTFEASDSRQCYSLRVPSVPDPRSSIGSLSALGPVNDL